MNQFQGNAFPESNLPVNMRGSPVVTEKPGRFGLMRAAIGANFAMRCKDGKMRAFTVREAKPLAKRLDEVRKDPKAAQPHFVCFHAACRNRKWDSEEALLGDHPDLRIMRDQNEAHVFALWCEAPEFADKASLETWRTCETSQ